MPSSRHKDPKRSSSSNHSSHRSSQQSRSSSYEYPSQWSGWSYDSESGCQTRRRLKSSAGDYEYETWSPPPEEPRNVQQWGSINELHPTDVQYENPGNYTTSPNMTSLTNDFLNTTLAPTSYLPQAGNQFGASSNDPTHIITQNPDVDKEEFNPQYRVHRSRDFKFGKVFKVLWSEPKGEGGGIGRHSVSSGGTRTWGQGDNADKHTKVRRFIIIKSMEGHSICLPINTYNGQGVNKKGVHAKDHTVIYSDKMKPHFEKGEKEKGLNKKPIKIKCDTRHSLDKMSRLNYAKTYTVEHNVKVCFIGKIHDDSTWSLGNDYNRVHPPLEPRGEPPSGETDIATNHAQGGTSDYFSQSAWGAGQQQGLGFDHQHFSGNTQYNNQPLADVAEGDDEEFGEQANASGEGSGGYQSGNHAYQEHAGVDEHEDLYSED